MVSGFSLKLAEEKAFSDHFHFCESQQPLLLLVLIHVLLLKGYKPVDPIVAPAETAPQVGMHGCRGCGQNGGCKEAPQPKCPAAPEPRRRGPSSGSGCGRAPGRG